MVITRTKFFWPICSVIVVALIYHEVCNNAAVRERRDSVDPLGAFAGGLRSLLPKTEGAADDETNKVAHTSDDQTSDEQQSAKIVKEVLRVVDVDAFPYTKSQMEERRSAFTMRGHAPTQSSESRGRLINEMYSELITSSKRQDPYLKSTSKPHACEPLASRSLRSKISPHM